MTMRNNCMQTDFSYLECITHQFWFSDILYDLPFLLPHDLAPLELSWNLEIVSWSMSKTSGLYSSKNGHCFQTSSLKLERLVIVPAVREILAANESCIRISGSLNAYPASCASAFDAHHLLRAVSTSVDSFLPVLMSCTAYGGFRFIERGTKPSHLLQQSTGEV